MHKPVNKREKAVKKREISTTTACQQRPKRPKSQQTKQVCPQVLEAGLLTTRRKRSTNAECRDRERWISLGSRAFLLGLAVAAGWPPDSSLTAYGLACKRWRAEGWQAEATQQVRRPPKCATPLNMPPP